MTGYFEEKSGLIKKTRFMAGTYKDLVVYQKAYSLALEIFKITENFDKSEKYSLTHQIRRSSRSVCTNIVEAYRKRQYEAYFVSKISDADMENSETQVWLDFALSFSYFKREIHDCLSSRSEEIGRMLNHMIHHPEKYRGTIKLKR
jgi:four helix bundle protein